MIITQWLFYKLTNSVFTGGWRHHIVVKQVTVAWGLLKTRPKALGVSRALTDSAEQQLGTRRGLLPPHTGTSQHSNDSKTFIFPQ